MRKFIRFVVAIESPSHLTSVSSLLSLRRILQLLNKRQLERLKERWWDTDKFKEKCVKPEDQADGISIQNIGGVFIVIFVGIGMACVTLAFEFWYYRYRFEPQIMEVTEQASREKTETKTETKSKLNNLIEKHFVKDISQKPPSLRTRHNHSISSNFRTKYWTVRSYMMWIQMKIGQMWFALTKKKLEILIISLNSVCWRELMYNFTTKLLIEKCKAQSITQMLFDGILCGRLGFRNSMTKCLYEHRFFLIFWIFVFNVECWLLKWFETMFFYAIEIAQMSCKRTQSRYLPMNGFHPQSPNDNDMMAFGQLTSDWMRW